MKKLFLLLLLTLVGISLVFSNVMASETRTQKHKFISYSANTAVAQSRTIFRISGYATSAACVFGIWNEDTLAETTSSDEVAIEGGEATQYDPIEPIDFGPEGLILDEGSTVVVYGGTIVIEYM